MKELLDKLSSYHLFNYFVPGVVFAVIAQRVTSYSFTSTNLVVSLFIYYFIGLLLSRIGSLIIEPFLKSVKFIRTGSYADFVRASMIDEKLEFISEANTMYRTLCSAFVILVGLKGYERIESSHGTVAKYSPIVGIVLLAILFALAYRKQTNYIVERLRTTMATGKPKED